MIAVILLILFSSCLAEGVWYVLPNTSPPAECPVAQCLTLDGYMQESSRFFTTGSSFLFLPGQHSTAATLNLTGMSNISFVGTENGTATLTTTMDIIVNNVTAFIVRGLTFYLQQMHFTSSQEVTITDTTFLSLRPALSGLTCIQSNITINKCHFEGTSLDAWDGTVLNLTGNTFTKSQALRSGGAIQGNKIHISLRDNTFTHNSAKSGGAIYCYKCVLVELGGGNHFHNNSATGFEDSAGGAIYIEQGSNFTATGSAVFSQNSAVKGGALAVKTVQRVAFIESNILFKENTASYKGGAFILEMSPTDIIDEGYAPLFTRNVNLTFINNSAKDRGIHENCGALCVYAVRSEMKCNLSATLINNTGISGGAVYIEKTFGVTLYNITAEGNSNGALGIAGSSTVKISGINLFHRNTNQQSGIITITQSTAKFTGNTTIHHNYANLSAVFVNQTTVGPAEFQGIITISDNKGDIGSGGIYCIQCTLKFTGISLFSNNTGTMGGAMYLDRGKVSFHNQTSFIGNRADLGGGIFVSTTEVYMHNAVTFSHNSAKSGGGMYMELEASVQLDGSTNLTTHSNSATEHGGVIYHNGTIRDIQCRNVTNMLLEKSLSLAVPPSFLQIEGKACPNITSSNDSAGIDGSFLYGGLLDRSRLKSQNIPPYEFLISKCHSHVPLSSHDGKNSFASSPFQLRFCGENNQSGVQTVYKGQTFTLQIEAIGQGNSVVPANVTASFNSSARLELNQSLQFIPGKCSNVKYNLYSTSEHEELTLYPKGPCETIGEGSTVINITFQPCPNGFVAHLEQCVCEERLKELNASCKIADKVSIVRYEGAKFWASALYQNGSYEGLILSQPCPAEYCVTQQISFSLDDPDSQCNFNHSGLLCGECAANFSLLLGGSRCGLCSNTYLLLLVPFALAGVVLIVFLSVLRLTVATGTVNSLILYANIVQVNKAIFFPSNRANPLTVFVAWMNLDFGFQVCFFDGMDVFAQTFLQFFFSVYVWSLILLIIFSSRYSLTVSRLIGSNPVAVLATLLLMSYNKILKVIIDVFSLGQLEYPLGMKVNVWLKDGNLLYLKSRHLVLAVFTLLVLVLVFIPYTLFLLLGHLLYYLPENGWYSWLVIKIKPLLDSCYAPYKTHTRHWTGFLLLVRCGLYVLFSYISLGGAHYSLLAIIVTFAFILSLTWLIHGGLYQHFFLDVVEVSVYANLVMLSACAATLPEGNRETASYVFVGMVFVTAVGLTLYHVHSYYLSKLKIPTWMKLKFNTLAGHQQEPDIAGRPLLQDQSPTDFREPLLV